MGAFNDEGKQGQRGEVSKQSGRNILVVDDDATWRTCVSLLLRPPHHVSLAADGIEAIELLQRDNSIDILLLDLMMPRCTGPEVFAWLEANRPTLAEHTILMTGGTPTASIDSFFEQSRCPKLLKPVESRDLQAAVNALAKRIRSSA